MSISIGALAIRQGTGKRGREGTSETARVLGRRYGTHATQCVGVGKADDGLDDADADAGEAIGQGTMAGVLSRVTVLPRAGYSQAWRAGRR